MPHVNRPFRSTSVFHFVVLIFILCPFGLYAQVSNKYKKFMKNWEASTIEKAERGDVAAMVKLANFYTRPSVADTIENTLEKNWLYDRDKAMQWLKRGDALGDGASAYFLGVQYEAPLDEKYKNKDSAIASLKRAAERNHVYAMERIAGLYRYWYNDQAMAMHYFDLAAKQGSNFASTELKALRLATADSYDKGLTAYNAGRYDEARAFWEAAAKINSDPKAAEALGDMYSLGKGVQRDEAKARRWYTHGAYRACAPCSFKLGNSWYYEGVVYWDRARQYWDSARVQGHLEAKTKIDMMDAQIAAEKVRAARAEQDRLTKQLTQSDITGGATSSSNTAPQSSSRLPAQQRKTCSVCKGTGGTTSHETYYGGRKDQSGRTIYGSTTKSSCTYCGGKGYVIN